MLDFVDDQLRYVQKLSYGLSFYSQLCFLNSRRPDSQLKTVEERTQLNVKYSSYYNMSLDHIAVAWVQRPPEHTHNSDGNATLVSSAVPKTWVNEYIPWLGLELSAFSSMWSDKAYVAGEALHQTSFRQGDSSSKRLVEAAVFSPLVRLTACYQYCFDLSNNLRLLSVSVKLWRCLSLPSR